MQYCTACQKAIATIVVMDLSEGAVTGSQHVCAACAEQLGVAPPKQPKFSSEMLEDLLGGLKEHRRGTPRTESCPGCGMTPAEFRGKGRLGCPRCYETFRHELMPLLQRIHAPTTVIHGRSDALIPLAAGEDLHHRIAGSRADFVPGMGHDLPQPLLARFADELAANAERAAKA